MLYMGIRADHSIFEMVLTLPWFMIDKKLPSGLITQTVNKKLYDFELNKFCQNLVQEGV